MTSLSRRSFVKGIAAMPLVMGVTPLARASSGYVRYDCTSAEGIDMLATYASAVTQMRALGADDPMSWMWQWYAHFVNGATTKAAELDRVFGTATSPMRTLAEETWDMCQPHGGQNANFFLPWHRMFVYYFERVVRYVSGRSDFTLPYWDYTSDDLAKRGILPPHFRMPDDPVFGSLYIKNRKAAANAGQPIQQNQPTDVMDISDTMAKANYMTSGGVTGFCRSVDSGIHSRIHVLVGTSTDMGKIPYAGNDPLFWVHHSNIDRIWASWTHNGGVNPVTATWAKKQFVMVDAGGVRVQAPLNQYMDEAALGYGYECLIPPPVAASATLAMAAPRTTAPTGTVAERVASARAAAMLGDKPTRVMLEPLAGARRSEVLGLDGTGKRAYLLLKDLHTWEQPGVLFHVYVGPGKGPARLDAAHHAGVINFFDAEFHNFGDPKMDMALGENLYSFDVTAILESLRRNAGGNARAALLVSIVPAGRPAGGSPMVGTIELVRQ
ncbi:MAG TPA: tyrosinase family protein [Xanthomonadaceae bacterium]|nr:tyrosinase family protein [Xanthomonadaceae bacterium]